MVMVSAAEPAGVTILPWQWLQVILLLHSCTRSEHLLFSDQQLPSVQCLTVRICEQAQAWMQRNQQRLSQGQQLQVEKLTFQFIEPLLLEFLQSYVYIFSWFVLGWLAHGSSIQLLNSVYLEESSCLE